MTEPPINRNPDDLDTEFRERLELVLAQLAAEGIPFKLNEGLRTVQRQQWLYGQGRPSAKPYGRAGIKVTNHDGVRTKSNHQSGCAADVYPATMKGNIIWPPPPSPGPRWDRLAEVAEDHGLVAGYRWRSPHDPPHVELRKGK